MRAFINPQGVLVLEPENETEVYATNCWLSAQVFTLNGAPLIGANAIVMRPYSDEPA